MTREEIRHQYGETKEVDVATDINGSVIYEEARPGRPAYYGYLGKERQAKSGMSLVVCVHGVSRDAKEQIKLLRVEAESRGYALLAPEFDESTYGDYQRLGRRGRGPRADLALREALSHFENRVGNSFGPVFLSGFSGGGQFVHRYAMAYPASTAGAVVTSAGWFTFPDPLTRYPRGIRLEGDLAGLRFEPSEFLKVPCLVAVGSRDTERDENFRVGKRLDAAQGRNRVERARNWARAMAAAAEARGLQVEFPTVEFPGAGHSFSECVGGGLDQVSFDFFDRIRDSTCE